MTLLDGQALSQQKDSGESLPKPSELDNTHGKLLSLNQPSMNGVEESSFDDHHLSTNTIPTMLEVPAWTPRRKLRVVTIGAGFSGLMFAHKLQHQHADVGELVDHQIYEARHSVGGTWLVNTYPGVQCDVPAHIYAFPFDPKPDWHSFYATGDEIQDYIKATVKKWNLDRDVRLKHRVMAAVWQEQRGQWSLTVETGGRVFEDFADLLISGQGVLNKWKWPDIQGLEAFKGHKCHSAAWDTNFDYSQKTIAVIGNGSSGVQIIPKVAELPGTRVIALQRSANYVYMPLPPAKLMGRDDDPSSNPVFTEVDKKRFCEDPEYHRAYRAKIIHQINGAFKMFLKDSPQNQAVSDAARKQMATKLRNDRDLCSSLIPTWGLGCRRITPGAGYLESLLRPNVQLVSSSVVRATEDSVVTADGQTFKVDVIVCATGFDVSLRPQWRMVGRGGVDLGDEWKADPESYLSVSARDMPNFFMFLGPNAVIAHGSLLEAVNWTGDYIVKWIRKIASEDIKSVTPKSSAVDEFIRYGDVLHEKMVWSDSCSSWFKRNTLHGRVSAVFPGSALLFRSLIDDIRAEDFDIEYRSSNRWEFLGSGFTAYEMDPANDLSWYIEH